MSESHTKPILVVGATGYVGGRLVPLLLENGYRVRAAGRSAEKIACRPWSSHPELEIVEADVLDRDSLIKAIDGCRAAFYLVHAMIAARKDFTEVDRDSARNMVAAAETGGLEQIIYLGGLGDVTDEKISKHLRSRHETGEILHSGSVPTTTLRAAMILGSGSASFEILRYLVEHLPAMITPRWVFTPNQPIAISNVLNYLIGCLENPQTAGQVYDIGGTDVLTYRDLLDIYAQEAGLPKRRIVPVPVLTPRLSSYWIHLVSPVPASIARPLTEGLASEAVCRENRIRDIIPQKLLSCREAIRLALDRIGREKVETCWIDAGELLLAEWAYCGDAAYTGGTVLSDGYRIRMKASVREVWEVICRLGGDAGWHSADRLWRLRGALDRLLGGVGMRRGRRHPSELNVGDAVDFWRVLDVSPPHRLLLLAEMKLPGKALLDFEVIRIEARKTELRLVSRFLPAGLGGIFYWHFIFLLHRQVFNGMLNAIAKATGNPVIRTSEYFKPESQDTCKLPD